MSTASTTPSHSPRKLDFTHAELLKLETDKSKPPENSIGWKLWTSSQDIANEALNSTFVQGIKEGTLSPDQYGHYSIQDCAYCHHGQNDYKEAADRATTEGFDQLAAFCVARYDSYASYTKSLLKGWHLSNVEALTPGPAAQAYIDFESMVAKTLHPIYIIVAMLPCDQLWPWLGTTLAAEKKEQKIPPNCYDFWITENDGQWGGSYRLDNFLNAWFAAYPDVYDEALATWVMQSCMTCEVNFFRGACGQKLLPMPEKPA